MGVGEVVAPVALAGTDVERRSDRDPPPRRQRHDAGRQVARSAARRAPAGVRRSGCNTRRRSVLSPFKVNRELASIARRRGRLARNSVDRTLPESYDPFGSGRGQDKEGGSMSNVPEGAQVSDDGQWWWDGTNWQPVEGGDGGGGSSSSGSGSSGSGDAGGGGEAKAPAFDFDNNGLLMSPENSPVESAGEPLKASFSVCNTGTAAGTAHVTLWIDGSDSGLVVGLARAPAGPVHRARRRLHPQHPRPVRGTPQVRGVRRPAGAVRRAGPPTRSTSAHRKAEWPRPSTEPEHEVEHERQHE